MDLKRLAWRPTILAIAAFVGMALAGEARAATGQDGEKRVALVIGNARYLFTQGQLRTPANDAALIGDALERVGFTVTIKNDLDFKGMNEEIRAFTRQTADADVAVVYYAGHGIEADGINYLVPIDARPNLSSDLQYEAVPLENVTHAVGQARRLKMIILDACRANPFAELAQSGATYQGGVGVGLGRPRVAGRLLVAYSTREGSFTSDGVGRDSPYAMALASHLPEGGVDVLTLMREVRDDVFAATSQQQEPAVYEALGEDNSILSFHGARMPPMTMESRRSMVAELARQQAQLKVILDLAGQYRRQIDDIENAMGSDAKRMAMAQSETSEPGVVAENKAAIAEMKARDGRANTELKHLNMDLSGAQDVISRMLFSINKMKMQLSASQ